MEDLNGLERIGKPDSVVALNASHSDHSSCPVIAHGVERPYPRVYGRTTQPSYLVLLRVGFAKHPPLLVDR
jgi:hypothetical protein